MKFQDDISNMNTYVRTYEQAETNMPPPLFQSWGHKNVDTHTDDGATGIL